MKKKDARLHRSSASVLNEILKVFFRKLQLAKPENIGNNELDR
ncbi:hypothetical protein [Ructibacterium gallinarum]|nr:hypothetical protein [Ructibacterium gallinarum]